MNYFLHSVHLFFPLVSTLATSFPNQKSRKSSLSLQVASNIASVFSHLKLFSPKSSMTSQFPNPPTHFSSNHTPFCMQVCRFIPWFHVQFCFSTFCSNSCQFMVHTLEKHPEDLWAQWQRVVITQQCLPWVERRKQKWGRAEFLESDILSSLFYLECDSLLQTFSLATSNSSLLISTIYISISSTCTKFMHIIVNHPQVVGKLSL